MVAEIWQLGLKMGVWQLGLKMGVSGRTKQTSKQVSNMLDFWGDTSSDLD